MSRIIDVYAREVLDSRGWPTVEADVRCEGGVLGRAIVPSGASTGAAEARELRDDDSNRHDGRGVRQAIANVCGELREAVLGLDPDDQAALDRRMIALDGTPQKARLGANAILAVSLAAAHAAAAAHQIPLWQHLSRLWNEHCGAAGLAASKPRLPLPMTNMISGGLHAGGNLDFQDVLVAPHGATDYATGLEWTTRVYRRLGAILAAAGYEGRLVGDEGGYGPRLDSNERAIELVVRAIEAAGLRPGADASIALDVAATHFYDGSHYRLHSHGREERLASAEMVAHVAALAERWPIYSAEDPLAEGDWPGWQSIVARLGDRLQIVGDDLIATNSALLRKAIDSGAANAVLIKPNQVGTLTETLATMCLARRAGFRTVVSARSGETEDASIADLAVATVADQIKIGAVVRGERLAKYNRLLRIAEELES